MKIIFATGNKGKLREAAEILGPGFELVTPAQMGITEDIEETGSTLKENSIIKAEYLWEKAGMSCFADDTGLEVDALGGAPGIYSARYAGPGHDFAANRRKLLSELARVGACSPAERSARFRSVVTLIVNGEKRFFEGTMEGFISDCERGDGGFGYDPVFVAEQYPDRTVSELGEEAKNRISHRGKALRAMSDYLNLLSSSSIPR